MVRDARRWWILVAMIALVMSGCNDKGAASTRPTGDTSAGDFAMADTGREDTGGGGRDTQGEDTQGEDTQGEDTQGEDTQGEDTAPEDVSMGLGAPYPIVLAHGMGGFEHLAGIEGINYFFRVEDHLRDRGHMVKTTEVDPLNSTMTVRGPQLLTQIEAYLEETGYAKVVIIAHSQGGLDARFVAHHRPDMVAAIVTVSTPHRGTEISDIVTELIDDERFEGLVDALVRFFGDVIYDELGDEAGLFPPLHQFSSGEIAAFNAEITDQPGVAYYSIAGRTDEHLGGLDCLAENPPFFIGKWNQIGDEVDPLLFLTEALLTGADNDNPIPSDGMVRVRDARWGHFLGCIPADHADEIGQVFDDRPDGKTGWYHLDFYADLATFLREEGF